MIFDVAWVFCLLFLGRDVHFDDGLELGCFLFFSYS